MGQSLTKILRKFQKPNERLSSYYIISTALIGLISIVTAVICFDTYIWITFLLYPLIFITLCRSVVLLHDAGHYALYKKRWQNSVAGNLMGLLNLIPSEMFSYMHYMHHVAVGNLDKRHLNPELKTLTTEEYVNASTFQKLGYRIMRSVFSRVILTPLGLFLVTRIPLPMLDFKGKLSALVYNVVITCLILLAVKYNFLLALIVGYFIPLFACYILVSIVFYLQHQFEETNWQDSKDWSLTEASLEGSSFLIFGKFMKIVTLNIGYHHIHHLNSGIPCYNLAIAHNQIKDSITYKEVKISKAFSHMRGKLWDVKSKKLIHYSEIKKF